LGHLGGENIKNQEAKLELLLLLLLLVFNLTSYSATLRVISSGGGFGLNGYLKKYVNPRRFSVFLMISELLERAEERRDGTEKDFLRFWRDGHEKK